MKHKNKMFAQRIATFFFIDRVVSLFVLFYPFQSSFFSLC